MNFLFIILYLKKNSYILCCYLEIIFLLIFFELKYTKIYN